MSLTFDLYTLNLLFFLVTLVQHYVSTKLEVLWLSYFEEVGGTGRTDIWTECNT